MWLLDWLIYEISYWENRKVDMIVVFMLEKKRHENCKEAEVKKYKFSSLLNRIIDAIFNISAHEASILA